MAKYKILFVDTETSGKVDLKTSYDRLEDWPYVLQLTAVLQEYDTASRTMGKVLDEVSEYIRYDGPIEEGAYKVHGITTDKLLKEGKYVSEVLSRFTEVFNEADFVCAHNTKFDMKMIKAEMLRQAALGHDKFSYHLRVKPWIDTMWYGNRICNLRNSRGGCKFPTLAELYSKVTGRQSLDVKLHDSANDVMVLIDCFQGLTKFNMFDDSHFSNLLAKVKG